MADPYEKKETINMLKAVKHITGTENGYEGSLIIYLNDEQIFSQMYDGKKSKTIENKIAVDLKNLSKQYKEALEGIA